jgi:hypothetical protein
MIEPAKHACARASDLRPTNQMLMQIQILSVSIVTKWTRVHDCWMARWTTVAAISREINGLSLDDDSAATPCDTRMESLSIYIYIYISCEV